MHRRALLSACGMLLTAGCLGDRTGSPGATDETKSTNTTGDTSTIPSQTTTKTRATCTARGAVEPTDDVLGASGCDSDSASVTLEFGRDEACHAYLLLNTEQGSGDTVRVAESDVTGLPELQNAVAYLGSETTDVRVRTSKRRTGKIHDHLDSITEEYDSTTQFAFDDRSFTLLVMVEDCALTTETSEN